MVNEFGCAWILATFGFVQHSKINDAILNVEGIRIGIENKLNELLKKPLKDYEKKIDKEIKKQLSKINLKNVVDSYWKQLCAPISLNEFWLKTNPEKVLFYNKGIAGDKLGLIIGIDTKLKVVTEKPDSSNISLPNLTKIKLDKGIFNIKLPIFASYNYFETKLRNDLKGEEIKEYGVTITINDVHIRGLRINDNVGGLLITLNVKGKGPNRKRFKGNLYFTAIPSINDTLKQISIKDFKLVPSTDSWLINNGLPFLTEKLLYKEVKKHLVYSYKSEYENYYKLIENSLKIINFNGLQLNGKLNSFTVPSFYISEDGIEILLYANGQLNYGVNK